MEMEITNSGDRNDSHVHVERASKQRRASRVFKAVSSFRMEFTEYKWKFVITL